ncbi:alpha-glucosidase [Stenotrophomonas panacihumi]|nr:alpha-glucosidase [Stenotrophomonas panacihumi]
MSGSHRLALAWLPVVFACTFACQAKTLRISSPEQHATLEFSLSDGGQASYRVLYDGREIIAPSALGWLERDAPKSRQWVLQGSKESAHDSTYVLPAGKTRVARDRYRELRVALADQNGARMDLVFRSYDEGIAFRYVLPKATQVRIRDELTGFAFAGDYPCWSLNLGHFGTSHEGEFDAIPASRLRSHNRIELPLVCQADAKGTTLAIAEADLRDYAGLYLAGPDSGALGVVAKLSPRLDDPSLAVSLDAGGRDVATPWRVVMLGAQPGALISSTLIENLNPPGTIADTSWIRPGKSAWDWWSGWRAPDAIAAGATTSTASLKRYIDHAQSMGLEYMLVDDGWYHGSTGDGQYHADANILQPVAGLDLPAMVQYARERDVGLWLWTHWRALDAHMDEALAWYEQLGIKGIKVDFMDRDDQQMVDFYHRLLARAAAHHLLVDLHGAYHPTGLSRTYPNLLTQEGVLGAEYNKWSTRATAGHNLTLPFTRMLLGPMDYTPGGFRNVTPAQFKPRNDLPLVMTTRAQQLAMYVVYESPFAVVADSPDAYAGAEGVQFLRDVPARWDETRVPGGAIGEHILVARRHGRDWYVGAMTNEQSRTLQLPLDFLGPGRWRATLYLDGAAPDRVDVQTREVDARSAPLALTLAGSGGAAVRFEPLRP